MNRTTSRQLNLGICGLAALGLLAVTQGCGGSGGNSTGTGGTTSSTAAGGRTGTAGNTGTPGTGGTIVDAGPPLCTGTAPTNPSIADFTADGGVSGVPSGGVYNYAATALTAPPTSTATGALVVTVATGPVARAGDNYAGFGIPFNGCTDASAYSGVKFNIFGSLSAGCTIQFSATFSEDARPGTGSPAGRDSCSAVSCYPPAKGFTLPPAAADVTVNFIDVTGGAPLTVIDKARLTGIQWQVNVPEGDAGGGCTGTVTIDNVVFVP